MTGYGYGYGKKKKWVKTTTKTQEIPHKNKKKEEPNKSKRTIEKSVQANGITGPHCIAIKFASLKIALSTCR